MTTPMEPYRAALRLTTDWVSREELSRQVRSDPRLTEAERQELLSFSESRRLPVFA